MFFIFINEDFLGLAVDFFVVLKWQRNSFSATEL
jgi:hypothetical protein